MDLNLQITDMTGARPEPFYCYREFCCCSSETIAKQYLLCFF